MNLHAHSRFMILSPFGKGEETISSTRYYWDSARRGKEAFVIIQQTLEGYGLFEHGGKTLPVPANHAFLAIIPEEGAYYYPREATEPWRFRWINFYGQQGVELVRGFRETFGPVLPLPAPSVAGQLFEGLSRSANRRHEFDPCDRSIRSYTFMMEWVRLLTERSRERRDPIDTAHSLCASRFREPLGVKELAEAVGMTREHFTRLFTERTGVSPAAHLRSLRVAAAREMLRQTRMPLKETAFRCGFPSVRSLRRGLEEEAR